MISAHLCVNARIYKSQLPTLSSALFRLLTLHNAYVYRSISSGNMGFSFHQKTIIMIGFTLILYKNINEILNIKVIVLYSSPVSL